MTTYYLGTAYDGRIASRKSKNPNFTHAAINEKPTSRLPSFSTSASGAVRNFETSNGHKHCIVIDVRKVSAAEYRAALLKRGG